MFYKNNKQETTEIGSQGIISYKDAKSHVPLSIVLTQFHSFITLSSTTHLLDPSQKNIIVHTSLLFSPDMYLKAPEINFEPRRKKKMGDSVRAHRAKKIVKEARKKEFVREMNKAREETGGKGPKEVETQKPKETSVLDRFRYKRKVNI
ncbi:hypothetical protein AAG570_011176 [Ranatra chinensis]|uniref:Uncharacterized protein n=1 Tax=Ranatra chinensis TaxID=642074 RepID=A0ABD0YK38_9HEMI